MGEPIMNAYPDEQEVLDMNVEAEALFWAAVSEVEDLHRFKIRLKLENGEPHMVAEKIE